MTPHAFFGRALLAALLLATAAPASAEMADTADLAGRWNGQIAVEGRRAPVPFTMDITAAAPEAKAGTIRWGAPFSCKNELQFSGKNASAYLLTVRSGMGPFCDRLTDGVVEVTPSKPGTAAFTIFDRNDRKLFGVAVERMSR